MEFPKKDQASLLQQRALLREKQALLAEQNAQLLAQRASLLHRQMAEVVQQHEQVLLSMAMMQGSAPCAVEGGCNKLSTKTDGRSRASTTCSFLSSGLTSCEGDDEEENRVQLTTVMMRNIPKRFSRHQLLDLIDDQGFATCYDLLYRPLDFTKRVFHSYAMINFISTGEAKRFMRHFNGFSDWKIPSSKVCKVSWSDDVHGFELNVARYRNVCEMHESVKDELRPVAFRNGKRIPFPPPTETLAFPPVPW
jgi:hypothetical protein